MKLSIDINDDIESLIKLRDLPNNRYSNRSWRLFKLENNNHHNIQHFEKYFSDLDKCQTKFELISADTSNTLTSKTSKLSLYTPSDDDDLRERQISGRQKNNIGGNNTNNTGNNGKLGTIPDEDDKKIFYIDNTPSPNKDLKSLNNDSKSDLSYRATAHKQPSSHHSFNSTGSAHSSHSKSSLVNNSSFGSHSDNHNNTNNINGNNNKPTMKRQDSLFSNFNLQRAKPSKDFINEESSDEESEIDESEIDESEVDESDISDSDNGTESDSQSDNGNSNNNINKSKNRAKVSEDESQDKLSPINNSTYSHSSHFHSSHLSMTRLPSQSQHSNFNLNSNSNSNPNSHSNSHSNSNSNYQNHSTTSSKRINQSISSIRKSDDSEWLSVSSEDEEPQPINFVKRNTTSELSSSQPRSLLSGLFLNEMKGHISAHTTRKTIDNADLDDNDNNNQEVLNNDGKPILKRSSTTGVITSGNNNEKLKIQKPTFMFQKRFTLMTDIKPLTEGKEIDFNEQNTEDGNNDNNNNDDNNDEWKQKSIVGLSDISASFKNHETSDVSKSLSKYQTRSLLSLATFFRKSTPTPERPSSQRHPSSETQTSTDLIIDSTEDSNSHSNNNGSREDIELPKMIKNEPKKKSKQREEFSKSLKDSLKIDNDLGKVPLPDKIVGVNGVNFMIEDDVDDYHSKGW